MLIRSDQRGFTLVEMLVVITLIGLVGSIIYTFTISSSNNYLKLHADGIRFSEISDKSQRMVRVLRGTGDVTEATQNAVTAYAYFSPADQYYSIVRYYVSTSGDQLLADVTQLTSNPPIGVPIDGSMKTFVVMDNFYDDPNVSTFEYLDSAGNPYPLPITDLHIIKGIRVNLATANKRDLNSTKTNISVQVTLRNRKTNL